MQRQLLLYLLLLLTTVSSSGQIEFHFYNKDHLGNVREVVDTHGNVEQVVHYYPSGTPFTDGSGENDINIEDILTLEVDMAPFQPTLQDIEIKNTITISHKYDNIAGSSPIKGAKRQVTREEDKYKTWNPTKEHSVDSFTQEESWYYFPEGDRTKGGICDIWEQK